MSSMANKLVSREDIGVGGETVMNNWLSNLDMNWSLNSNWSSDSDIMDDLSDGDFWLNLGDLWNDLSVSSDWGQNLLLGYKGSEITGLGGSNRYNGSDWCWSRNDMLLDGDWCGGAGLNDLGISDSHWGSSDDILLHGDWRWSRNDMLLDGDCWSRYNVLLDSKSLKSWS